ncbi:MAG TPA: 2-oxoacid:acceptor oxidoreductase family protein, partial [Limnochordia bacterium]
MPVNDLTVKLAGAQGHGIESTGPAFAKAIARTGVYVCGLYDFMSRIRGGHYFFQIRVNERPIYSHRETVHLLLAFNEESIDLGIDQIPEGGGVIYDAKLKVDASKIEAKGVRAFAMPLTDIAVEVGDALGVGSKITGGSKVMANTAATAAAAGIIGLDLAQFDRVLRENFGRRKGSEIAEANSQVAKAAYEMAAERYGQAFPWKLKPVPHPKQRVVITGNYALAMGALAAGCQFISAYPMTPASSILEWLVAHDKYGVVHKQTEDELAAILFAIGASHVGARAMTATSGGGF